MPINEQETTISYSRDSQEVTVWTSDRTVMTKLDRLCETAPDYYRLTETAYSRNDGTLISKSYTITDKAMLSFRSKRSKPELTDEQRAALSERAKALKFSSTTRIRS